MAPPTYRIPPCAGDSGVTLGKREQKDEEPRLEDGAWRKRHGREKSVEQDRYLTRGAASQKELRSAFRPRHDDPWRSDTLVVTRCRVQVAADGGAIGHGWRPEVDTQKRHGVQQSHHSVAMYPERCGLRVGDSAAGATSTGTGGLRVANGPAGRSRCPRRRDCDAIRQHESA